MKREEKNALTQKRILQCAVREFAGHGFEAASMNAICRDSGVSKGNLYYYFESKEALYLECVRLCLSDLTESIRHDLAGEETELLDRYFDARMRFFREHPDLELLFCRSMVVPEGRMKEEVLAVRREFEALNAEVIGKVLKGKKLRGTLTEEEVRELFRMLQEMWNSEGLRRTADAEEAERRERACREMIGVFFYGVLEREGETLC